MLFEAWRQKVSLMCGGVSCGFKDFVKKRFNDGHARQQEKSSAGKYAPLPEVKPEEKEVDNGLTMCLMSNVPDRAVREMGRGGGEDPSSLKILDELLRFVSPGGEVESDSLRECVASPGAKGRSAS